MKIALIGKFEKMYDEEYIAKSFEMLGHNVIRYEHNIPNIYEAVNFRGADVVIFTKWNYIRGMFNVPSVCWVFDLYWGYPREELIKDAPFFKADHVFTTDGGHEDKWKELGINHKCVRQGIYSKECYILEPDNPDGIVFVGSDNHLYPDRTKMIRRLEEDYKDVKWYGRKSPDFIRGDKLNVLYSKTKIVVGDSVYSPHYWSNRVVETLGRGGFLIHRDVPGLKEEYPYLVTYDGTYDDLKKKIDYYLSHEDERREVVKKNFEWVRDNYTCEKQCQKLLNYIS